jgi:hypothetical protein
MVARPALALLLIAFLSGCVVEGDGAGDIPAGAVPDGEDAGTAAPHATADKDDGGVSVERSSGRYTARQVLTYSNDFGGASRATVTLGTGAGGVTARAWDQGGYKTVVVLQATADTDEEARVAIGRLTVQHSDRVASGTLTLTTRVLFPTYWDDVSYSGIITANLPEEPAYMLALDTGSGGATATGLGGPSVVADTGSGGVHIDGAFGRMEADTGSGGVELTGTANSVVADTGSGGVVARLRPTASGTWSFDTGSGGIDVTVLRSSGVGCDVLASNGSGSIDIELDGGTAVGEQDDDEQHVRTSGFADADVQTKIVADAGSGDIDVSDD